MIAVDTSVWIEFFRGRNQSVVDELNRLLDIDEVMLPIPVIIELLLGASKADSKKLKEVLSALPRYYPQLSTWRLMQAWGEEALRGGYRLSMGDLLIATIASEANSKLWSLDKHFKQMEHMGFISLHSS